jgi:hypothetical protein
LVILLLFWFYLLLLNFPFLLLSKHFLSSLCFFELLKHFVFLLLLYQLGVFKNLLHLNYFLSGWFGPFLLLLFSHILELLPFLLWLILFFLKHLSLLLNSSLGLIFR